MNLSGQTKLPIVDQISAGGVAFRQTPAGLEVALIAVGQPQRWQLPKGIIDPGETPEIAAVREVREEAGIDTHLLSPLQTIEYWYVGNHRGRRVRFHKFVHFFLLTYRSGQVSDYDRREVQEARWFSLKQALKHLTFDSERQVVQQAGELIHQHQNPKNEPQAGGTGLG